MATIYEDTLRKLIAERRAKLEELSQATGTRVTKQRQKLLLEVHQLETELRSYETGMQVFRARQDEVLHLAGAPQRAATPTPETESKAPVKPAQRPAESSKT